MSETNAETGGDTAEGTPTVTQNFKTGLEGPRALLAWVLDQGLTIGDRTPQDFLRHFPARDIMSALPGNLRADILIGAGVLGPKMHKMAEMKSKESAGEDLQMALDGDGTDATTIATSFPIDTRVMFLDPHKLWVYITESAFWKRSDDARAQAYVAFILDVALQTKILLPKQIVDALTMARLAVDLPKEQLGEIIAAALADEHKFTETTLVSAVPPGVIVKYVNLTYIWEQVVEPLIAQKYEFVTPTVVEPTPQSVAADEVIDLGDTSDGQPADGTHPKG